VSVGATQLPDLQTRLGLDSSFDLDTFLAGLYIIWTCDRVQNFEGVSAVLTLLQMWHVSEPSRIFVSAGFLRGCLNK